MKFGTTETKQQRATRLENERVQKSNRLREIETQRGLIAELDLMLFQSRDRISELKKEIAELEQQAVRRERRLMSARARLAVLESAA